MAYAGLKAFGCATCCEPPISCDPLTDNFNRANSTNLGVDWTEVAGDWSIASNVLTTSSTAAVAIFNQTAGLTTGTVSCIIPQSAGSLTRKLRLIGAYTDIDNYIFVEFDYNTTSVIACLFGLSAAGLYQRVGGVETLLCGSEIAPPDVRTGPMTVTLCWNGTSATALLFRTSGTTFVASTCRIAGELVLAANCSLTGNQGGVGTGSVATGVRFDSFSIKAEYVDSAPCDGCLCSAICEDGLPPTVEITLPSRWTDNACASCDTVFNGQAFVLDLLDDAGMALNSVSGIVVSKDIRACLYRYVQSLCGQDWHLHVVVDQTITVSVDEGGIGGSSADEWVRWTANSGGDSQSPITCAGKTFTAAFSGKRDNGTCIYDSTGDGGTVSGEFA